MLVCCISAYYWEEYKHKQAWQKKYMAGCVQGARHRGLYAKFFTNSLADSRPISQCGRSREATMLGRPLDL